MAEIKISTKFNVGQTIFFVSTSNRAQDRCSQCGGWDYRQVKLIYHTYEGKIQHLIIDLHIDGHSIAYQTDNGVFLEDVLFATREEAEQHIKEKVKEIIK